MTGPFQAACTCGNWAVNADWWSTSTALRSAWPNPTTAENILRSCDSDSVFRVGCVDLTFGRAALTSRRYENSSSGVKKGSCRFRASNSAHEFVIDDFCH